MHVTRLRTTQLRVTQLCVMEEIMSNTLTVTPRQIYQQINRTDAKPEELTTTLMLAKSSGGLTGYHATVKGAKGEEGWIQLHPSSFALDPIYPTYTQVELKFVVPADAVYGRRHFTVEFVAEDQPADQAVVAVELSIQRPGQQWVEKNVWLVLGLALLLLLAVIILSQCSGVGNKAAADSVLPLWRMVSPWFRSPVAYGWEAML